MADSFGGVYFPAVFSVREEKLLHFGVPKAGAKAPINVSHWNFSRGLMRGLNRFVL